jgi:hypothetical protein
MGTMSRCELIDVEEALGRDLTDNEIDVIRAKVDQEVDRRVLTCGEQLSLFSLTPLAM